MDDIVHELNMHYMHVFIPNIIWTIIRFLLGLVGNSLVLYVYKFKVKHQTEGRYFIPVLAVFDLSVSVFSSIYFISDYLNYGSYPSGIFCKTIGFLTYTTLVVSAHLLSVNGIQRYMKICRPLGPQMTLFWRRIAVAVTIIVSVGYSSPILLSAGIVEFQTSFKGRNVTVKSCSWNAQQSKEFNTVYSSITLAFVLFNIIAIIAVYVPTSRVIYRSLSKKKPDVVNHCDDHSHEMMTSSSAADPAHKKGDEVKTTRAIVELSSDTENQVLKFIEEHNACTRHSENRSGQLLERPKTPVNSIKMQNRKRRSKVNFSRMFLTIIIIYLLSYIPTATMFFVKSKDKLYWHKLSDFQLSLQLFILRFNIVNNIVNQFIYGYFDFKFRKYMKSLFNCNKS